MSRPGGICGPFMQQEVAAVESKLVKQKRAPLGALFDEGDCCARQCGTDAHTLRFDM